MAHRRDVAHGEGGVSRHLQQRRHVERRVRVRRPALQQRVEARQCPTQVPLVRARDCLSEKGRGLGVPILTGRTTRGQAKSAIRRGLDGSRST